MRKWYFSLIMVAFFGTCWANATTEYSWKNIDEPFQETISIPLYGKAVLTVNIPDDYINTDDKHLTVRMAISTPFRPGGIDIVEFSGFSTFSPSAIVNGKRFTGACPFQYKYVEGQHKSNAYIKIKTKKLHPGDNMLTFEAGRRDSGVSYSCGGDQKNCAAIYIHKLWVEK